MSYPDDWEWRRDTAAKYGWDVLGWAVDKDNPAGISLYSKYDRSKFLRMQHAWDREQWEKTLAENVQLEPKGFRMKDLPKLRTFDDVVAENEKLKAQITRLKAKLKGVGLIKSRRRK